ncbi:fatty-acyl-CoA synthase [Paractinoplanes deccanensis]|uniref:Fatty-acyl-CoA synthase n=1 Tax=Paractinoplanes deccanensis TaxID=113561 RepID=A0ABQ3Y425_9ACTN|nr:long-chain fatty acid--CoA ligase [Actinoplanes deccanensis]GID74705.1 fatty-acyl-CoA synthase [Actinoplanes deccanensis]
MNRGLGSWPARRAAISPDRVALVFGDDSWTYAELRDRVTRLAHRLRAEGVGRGDRVAYLGPNHPALVETLFATHLLGGVFVPLNFRLTAPEVRYQLGHSGARVLIRDPECAEAKAPTTIPVTALTETSAETGPPIEVEVGLDDPAFLLYTSGTTGRPKGAILTHGNVVWNTYNLLVGVDVAGDEVTLIGAPLFHVAALNQCLLPTVLKGGRSVIMPSWNVDQALDLIERHRVTWMFGVAAMFAALARSPRWASTDLSSLRCVMSGGAAVPPALIRAYQERGLTFCQGYGMTETAPGATFLEARESLSHVGSAGVPVFFTDVRCVRPDLTDAAPGEPGEVLVRGPNVTPGYWEDPAATADAFADGWLRTGDIAAVGEDGHFRILDRLKDMYISGGENVYPAEVEAALFTHPGVAEVAVIGVPDEKWGEAGRAFIVPAAGHRPTAGELREHLAGRLAKYKIPAHFTIVDDLPKTGSNKVRKADLRSRPL